MRVGEYVEFLYCLDECVSPPIVELEYRVECAFKLDCDSRPLSCAIVAAGR